MCQIITLKSNRKGIQKVLEDTAYQDDINQMLDEKGGDYYGYGMLYAGESYNGTHDDFGEMISSIDDIIVKNDFTATQVIQIIFFSRQKPEMETTAVLDQPYRIQNNNKDYFIGVHGTIHNDQYIKEKYNVEAAADTEVLKNLPFKHWKEADGAFVVLGISSLGVPVTYEHGLKLWNQKITCCGVSVDIIATCDLSRFNTMVLDLKEEPRGSRTLMASFSGGMDIALSTFKELSSKKYSRLVLNYFAWGSAAEDQEIQRLKSFADLYKEYFPEIQIDLDIIDAEEYFKQYFEINEAPLPKISKYNQDSTADEKETESPIAYVPYRNTQFAILLASKAEARELKHVTFIFGLNLSEGMVYMDNSEGWLRTVQDIIQLGGKDPKITTTYETTAPYFARTKTSMIKRFNEEFGSAPLEQLLSLSYSCYYPDPSGAPCGKCGSCILRAKAQEHKINT